MMPLTKGSPRWICSRDFRLCEGGGICARTRAGCETTVCTNLSQAATMMPFPSIAKLDFPPSLSLSHIRVYYVADLEAAVQVPPVERPPQWRESSPISTCMYMYLLCQPTRDGATVTGHAGLGSLSLIPPGDPSRTSLILPRYG